MPKYIVEAVQTNYCEFEIEAESLEDAVTQLDDWIEDDLLEHREDSKWEYEVKEIG
jgi:hypothetical protein